MMMQLKLKYLLLINFILVSLDLKSTVMLLNLSPSFFESNALGNKWYLEYPICLCMVYIYYRVVKIAIRKNIYPEINKMILVFLTFFPSIAIINNIIVYLKWATF